MKRAASLLVTIFILSFVSNGQWLTFGSQQASPVVVTGSYRMIGQTSGRQGTFQEKPADLWRVEVNPTLIIYGIPITANLLLSSEQQGIRQNINAFSLMLDPDAIKRVVVQRAYRALEAYAKSEIGWMLNDCQTALDSLAKVDSAKFNELQEMCKLQEMRDVANGNIKDYTDVLNSMGLMSDVEKVMSQLPKIAVGAVFPVFSPITLSGARLEGAWVEWNPGQSFYVSAVYGTTQRPLTRIDTFRVDTSMYTTYDNSNFGRSMYGARIGSGSPGGSHILITGIYIVDDKSTLVLPDSGVGLTPQKNYLSSFDFKLEPIKNVWTLEAELAGSITVADQNAPTFGSPDVPEFLLNLVDSSASTYADWALTAATTINVRNTNTKLTGKLRRIGTGYRALGVPNLRTDYLRYDGRIDQFFFKRQLSVGAFVRQDRDNLIPVKRATSTLFSAGANLGLSIRGLPYFRASYAPYVQESDATDTLLQYINRTVLWSVSSGYGYRIGKIMSNTNITVSKQDAETKNNLYDYSVVSLTGTQSFTFQIPFNFSIGLGYIEQTSAQTPGTSIFTADGSGGYSFTDAMTLNAGLNLAFDQTYGTRTGFFISYLARIENVADIDLRAERNYFTARYTPALLGEGYRENLFRLTISKVW